MWVYQSQPERDEVDYEQFLRDIEADEELRASMNVYKNPHMYGQHVTRNVAMDTEEHAEVGEMDEDGSEGLEIPMEQLIDEVGELELSDVED